MRAVVITSGARVHFRYRLLRTLLVSDVDRIDEDQ
jgi:hypothetical protein